MFGLILASLSLAQAPRCAVPPPAHWIAAPEGLPHHYFLLDVRLDGRTILWAGRPVSRRRLRLYLMRSRRLEPRPVILFDASAAADCAQAAALRALIDEAAECGAGGLCGEGRKEEWMI